MREIDLKSLFFLLLELFQLLRVFVSLDLLQDGILLFQDFVDLLFQLINLFLSLSLLLFEISGFATKFLNFLCNFSKLVFRVLGWGHELQKRGLIRAEHALVVAHVPEVFQGLLLVLLSDLLVTLDLALKLGNFLFELVVFGRGKVGLVSNELFPLVQNLLPLVHELLLLRSQRVHLFLIGLNLLKVQNFLISLFVEVNFVKSCEDLNVVLQFSQLF